MKKLLFVLVLTCLLVFGIVATVSADNGPHGNFTATTDACANCHRAHSAQVGSNQLLVTTSAEALCTSCHDGTGASTDVENGVYHAGISPAPNGAEGTDGSPLFGGGFTRTLMATAWSGKATFDAAFNGTPRATTSAHSLGPNGIVYGSGATSSLPLPGYYASEARMTLECTSCHDPHGNAGYKMTANTTTFTWSVDNTPVTAPLTKVATYRLLRFQPQGSGSFTAPAVSNWSGGAFPSFTSGGTTTSGWTVPDNVAVNGAEWYTIGTNGSFALGDYNAGNATNAYNPSLDNAARPNYITSAANVPYFCAQCHDRYFANTRLRNNTDASAYCGAPVAGVTVGTVLLTVYADADGVAPWINPKDPTRCEAVVNATTGALTGWGDNGGTGDTVHAWMHSSGDVLRASADGAYAPTAAGMTAPTSVGRACTACHVAHGTSAAMTAIAGQANQVYAETTVASSTLLRMDNRSLCLRCHASAVGFTVGP